MVKETLRDYPETRNCDKKLTVQLWKTFFPEYIYFRKVEEEGNEVEQPWVRCENILKLPPQDSISRCRQKVQNDDGMYPPTEIEVVRKRKMNEEEWKRVMSTEYKRL